MDPDSLVGINCTDLFDEDLNTCLPQQKAQATGGLHPPRFLPVSRRISVEQSSRSVSSLTHGSALVSKRRPAECRKGNRRRDQPSATIAGWKQQILNQALNDRADPPDELIQLLASNLEIEVGSCWQFMKQGTIYRPRTDQEPEQNTADPGATESNTQVSKYGRGPPGEIELTPKDLHRRKIPSSHPHSPPWTQLVRTCSTAPPTPQADQESARIQELPNDSPELIDSTGGANPEIKHIARKYANRVELSDVGAEDDDNDDGLAELSMEEEVATCFGPELAHFALNALEKIVPVDLLTLLRTEHQFQQCTSATESNPGLSSSQTQADLPATTKASSSPGRNKRKAPAGNGDENDQDGDGDGEGEGDGDEWPSKRVKDNSEAQLRWDCPLNRIPSGAAGNAPGCAKTGLVFKDLWRHLRRDHACPSNRGPRFDDHSASSSSFSRTTRSYIGSEDMKKMAKEYRNKDPRDLQKTWAAWWLLIHEKTYPGHSPPCGVHQGTISFPSAVIPDWHIWIKRRWEMLEAEGKLPQLTNEQRRRMEDLNETALRGFSSSHEVRQRHTRKPVQTVQMPLTLGPAKISPDSANPVHTIPSAENGPLANDFFSNFGDFLSDAYWNA